MVKPGEAGMDVCHEVAMLFTHCLMDERYYVWEHKIWSVEVFYFYHAPSSIVNTESVEFSQISSFRKLGCKVKVRLSGCKPARRRLQALCRDNLRPVEVEADEIDMKRHPSYIFGVPRLKWGND